MKPPWLKVRAPGSPVYRQTSDLIDRLGLNTVCKSARCPNIGECFGRRTATFLLLGDVCSRNCAFCAVRKGIPDAPDPDEPERVARAVQALGLRYLVLTSVTRDDLADGGAGHFARTVERIGETSPDCLVEVLVPDFRGDMAGVRRVVFSSPHVFGHNLETVPSLYSHVRWGSDYLRSLRVLERAKQLRSDRPTKSGLMLGLGEEIEEVVLVMRDLRDVGCDILTLGQYLSPSRDRLPVTRYLHPDEFQELGCVAMGLGFQAVESGPLVRSSYRADETARHLMQF